MKVQNLNHPPTKYLYLWLMAACSAYVCWLGFRPVVLVSGLAISLATILFWQLLLRRKVAPVGSKPDNNDLLDVNVFRRWLGTAFCLPEGANLNEIELNCWQKAYAQSEAIHQYTVAIARQDARFIPDLLETLHTVLELVSQFLQAFGATRQMKTLPYQKMAQQQILTSQYRLAQTQQQLQELHDQLLAENMELQWQSHSSSELPHVASGVSSRLQTLISINKEELALKSERPPSPRSGL